MLVKLLRQFFLDHNQFSQYDFDQRFYDNNRNVVGDGWWSFELPFPKLVAKSLFERGGYDIDDGSILKISVIPLELMFWLKTFVLLSIQSLINACVAIIVYKLIVTPNYQGGAIVEDKTCKKHQSAQNGVSSTFSPCTQQQILLVYGILVPVLLVGPFYMFLRVPQLSTNVTLMLCCCGAFPILVFRIFETISGQIPNFAIDSLQNFLLYYGASLSIKFDPKTKKPIPLTLSIFRTKLSCFVNKFLFTSILFSILMPFEYKIAPERPIHSLLDLYYWGNIVNAYMMAGLTSLLLDAGASGLGLLQSMISRKVFDDFHDSPLTKSTSSSDFWSNRWDKPVQSALKNGIYKPILQYLKPSEVVTASSTARSSKQQRYVIAAIGTFVVSGILHEYVWYFMSFRITMQQQEPFGHEYLYQPNHGHQMIFFLWNGILLLVERILRPILIRETKQSSSSSSGTIMSIQNYYSMIPQPIQTLLVLLLVLPVSHLFTDAYIRSSFYQDASFGFPICILSHVHA